MEGSGDKATRVLLVGDAFGVAQTLRIIPPSTPVGIVAASNRPQYHDELRRIAAERGLPLFVQPRPEADTYAAFVAEAVAVRPDLILCNSYSMILRADLLAVASRGGVNVHGGKLPQFRGPNPIQWAIIEGERETAATMHELTPELDAGPVIAERRVPIRFTDTWRDVLQRLQVATDELLAAELPAVLAGTASSRPQAESAATHWPRRKPEDGRIDWSWTVARIHDFVRALGDGIPPAFYERDGACVEVERLSVAQAAALAFDPGPGGRRFVQGDLWLEPADGELLDFRVFRGTRHTGSARIEAVDLEARLARVLVEPEDADAAALTAKFARAELGFSVVG